MCFLLPFRPLNEREVGEKQPVVCKVEERNREVVVQLKANKNLSKSFFFDAAYSPSSTQRDIFEVGTRHVKLELIF